jgi:magnesium-transporting ATPase (P-type)
VVAKMSGETLRLEASNLILRGCTLKNTEWVLGMVLFAGVDTKIFRNRAAVPRKVSAALWPLCLHTSTMAQYSSGLARRSLIAGHQT